MLSPLTLPLLTSLLLLSITIAGNMNPALSLKRRSSTDTDFSLCIFCQTFVEVEISTLTSRGLPTIINALEMRKDHVYDRLGPLVDTDEKRGLFLSQQPKYHAKCRNDYTHKKHLQHSEAKRQKVQMELSSTEKSDRNRRTKVSPDYKTRCFLCEKQRDSKGNWGLVLVATKEREQAIHNRVKEIGDQKILTRIQGHGEVHIDMIAADFRYHRSCMNKLMGRTTVKSSTVSSDDTCGDDAYDSAFTELVNEITDPLLKDSSIYYTGQLKHRYRDLLDQKGVQNSMIYSTHNLQKRLRKHFGTDIQIIAQNGQASIVCSSAITVGEMVSLSAKLKQSLDESTLATESDNSDDEGSQSNQMTLISNDVYAVSKHLRETIKEKARDIRVKQKSGGEELESSLEISNHAADEIIPDAVYNLIAWMISKVDETAISTTGRVSLAAEEHGRVLSICQDIMSSVIQVDMPKQVGLALHVLRQTRSKDIVQILNKFGHSIGYKEAQKYITAMAQKVEVETIEQGIFVPNSVEAGLFTQYAMDNLDFHEDTKDGSTLHATSHNIYQYKDSCEERQGAAKIPQRSKIFRLQGQSEFLTDESFVSLKDRRKSRSLSGVKLTKTDSDSTTNHKKILQDGTFVWALLRSQSAANFNEEGHSSKYSPGTWNSFWENQENQQKAKTTIAYGPIFPQSPTKPDVVQASLDYFLTLSERLDQQTTVVTCDQAIYDIVKGISKKNQVKYKKLVVRLGGFHIIENFMGAIGYFMKGSGIEEILTESGICLKGTANKVIAGKDYYKMVRCHSLLCEALIRILWNAFDEWYRYSHDQSILIDLCVHLEAVLECLSENDLNAVNIHMDQAHEDLQTISPFWSDFCDQIGVTGHYWLMYIRMVLIAKRYIYAERAGKWEEHLEQVQNMLPYIVSAGHTKYMSCLPLYLKDMRELATSHPDVHQHFTEGKFTVRLTNGSFNGVWTDLALEQTYNKEGKTSLFKGISQNSEARMKYVNAVPMLTKVSESVKGMANVETQGSRHHGESKRQTAEDMSIVEKIQDVITQNMIDPFSQTSVGKTDLVNIVTGEKAHSVDLIHAEARGLEALSQAESTDAEKVNVPKLITFEQKKSKKSGKQSLTQIHHDESSVTRSLVFLQNADNATRQEAFSHEWANYPTSLFKPDETLSTGYRMRKGTKSDYLAYILSKTSGRISQPTVLPDSLLKTVYLIDGMAFVQRYQKLRARKFKDLPEQYLHKMLQEIPRNCKCINFVGDRYDFDKTVSLKGEERELRESQMARSREYLPADNLDIPSWPELVGNPRNKANLLSYISDYVCDHSQELIPEGITVILGGCFDDKRKAVAVRQDSQTLLHSLACEEHEEADTRLMTHMSYCSSTLGCKRVVVSCTDTDVIMLCMYHFCFLPLDEVWVQKGDTYLPLHDVVMALSELYSQSPRDLVETLLALYVISGCDTCSYPYNKGKRISASVALTLIGSIPNIARFGISTDVEVSESVFTEARRIFTLLYGKKHQFESMDMLRQHVFASGRPDLRYLPPTEDAFRLHVKRCLYQLLLYQRARESILSLPPPTDFGRVIVNGRLVPLMMTKPAKPPNIKTVACKCKASKCLRKCSCALARLKCFIGCLCMAREDKCGRLVPELDEDE